MKLGSALQAQQIAARLLNDAEAKVQRSDKTCTFGSPPTPKPITLSDGAPSRGMTRVLGVLRRAPTQTELNLFRAGEYGVASMSTVYRRYARIVTGPGNVRATIVPGIGQEYRPPLLYDPHCVSAVRKVLQPRLARQSLAVRRAAARLQTVVPIPAGPAEQLNLMVGPGGTGGFWNINDFRSYGIFLFGGTGGPLPPGWHCQGRPVVCGPAGNPKQTYRPSRPHSTFAGLVPDGVGTVTITLSTRVSHGPFAPTAVYPNVYTATRRVHDNMVFFTGVPRDAQDIQGRMTWRSAAGRIVRVVTTRR